MGITFHQAIALVAAGERRAAEDRRPVAQTKAAT
jgi:hypothetical protein